MHVIGTECARFAWKDYMRRFTRELLLKYTSRYDKGAGGLTVVVETGALAWQPADRPNVVVWILIQPLIPTVFAA
jgi:hypothetical protein